MLTHLTERPVSSLILATVVIEGSQSSRYIDTMASNTEWCASFRGSQSLEDSYFLFISCRLSIVLTSMMEIDSWLLIPWSITWCRLVLCNRRYILLCWTKEWTAKEACTLCHICLLWYLWAPCPSLDWFLCLNGLKMTTQGYRNAEEWGPQILQKADMAKDC